MRFLGWKKKLWLGISLALMVPGIIGLVLWKLPLGIDFKGGAMMEIKFNAPILIEEVRHKLTETEQAQGALVTESEGGSYLIRLLPVTEEEHQAIKTGLEDKFGQLTELQFQSVGPSVSQDLTKKAIIAVIVAALLIILYLAYSFRTVAYPVSSWRFGVVAVVALLHDLVISVGVFAILAHFFHYEVDASFITALLTIMGFSVHDTIVVFDRIRENALKRKTQTAEEFERLADDSLGQTLNRSLATSLTVMITLSALVVLGGETIRPFVVTLLVGIAVGAYSSIFTATPLLVWWQQLVFRRIGKK